MPGLVLVVADIQKSPDAVWFVKVKCEKETSDDTVIDDYVNKNVKVILPQVILKKSRLRSLVSRTIKF